MKFQAAQNNDNNQLNVKVSDESLSSIALANPLDVEVDQHLNLIPLIQSLGKRISSVCFKMSVLGDSVYLNTSQPIIAYYAYFKAVFQYCIEVLSAYQSHYDFKIQIKTIQILTFFRGKNLNNVIIVQNDFFKLQSILQTVKQQLQAIKTPTLPSL